MPNAFLLTLSMGGVWYLLYSLIFTKRKMRLTSSESCPMATISSGPFRFSMYSSGASETDHGASFSANGRYLFACEDGALRRVDIAANTSTEFGRCYGPVVDASPDGRFAAIPFGSFARVFREDGATLRLSTLSAPGQSGAVMLAVEEATGRFAMYGPEEALAVVQYREDGPITSAAMRAGADAPRREQSLLAEFFAAPEPATAPAPDAAAATEE